MYALLQCPDFINRHRTKTTAFTRTRKLPFHSLCLFLLNLVKGSTQCELDNFCALLNQQKDETRLVTTSAFSQAREYLKHTAFTELNDVFLTQCYQQIPLQTWRDHRLLAVDSSTLLLPDSDAITKHFGGLEGAYGLRNMGRLSACYDVCNGLTLDVQIAPYLDSERELAIEHLHKTNAQDLLLYDRGYPGHWFFAMHQNMNRHFCIRASKTFSAPIKAFVASDQRESLITFHPTKESRAACLKKGIAEEPITLRVMKIPLSSGEIEILITSLTDEKNYPYDEFHDLYGRRWGIEVDFDFKKNVLEIENFTGLSVHSVLQDISAKVLTQNIAMLAALIAQQEVVKRYAQRKLTYKVNISHCISKMKNTVVTLFVCNNPLDIFKQYIDILIKTVEAVRPGRLFKRKLSKWDVNRSHQNIKRAR
jgi:Transposase DDE domain